MYRIFTTLGLLLAVTFCLSAQTATEAYRFSLSDPLGTARNMGSGNSMFAIGADFSAIGSNPAGIGAFWKSEFIATYGMQFNHYTSNFRSDISSTVEGNYDRFVLPNVGFILASTPNRSLLTSNLAIGYNRVAEYRTDLSYAGHTLGSITDSWSENAAGLMPEQLNGFEEGLAYSTGAIYDFDEDLFYETDYQLSPDYRLYKTEFAEIKGGKSELFIGYGANLNDKVLLGASFNVPLVNSTEFRTYSEIDGAEDGVPYFNNLTFTRFVNSSGSGINGKFGITVKPVKDFHIAFAAHTPTKLFITDNYSTTLTYDYTDGQHDGPIYQGSPYGSFQYAVVTPWTLMGGIGIVAGRKGFIGANFKWTDYGNMRYDYSVRGNYNYYINEEQQVNQDIRSTYGSVFDINLGGEIVLQSWRLRGGVSLTESPYLGDNMMYPAYHAGFGYRTDYFYVDLAYKWASRDDGYMPYETTDATQPVVVTDYTTHSVSMTTGFKF